MNLFSVLGGNVSSSMAIANRIGAWSVTLFALYGSLVASTYASFWKWRSSQSGSVAFLRWSSFHQRQALYPLAAIDTAHAAHPYHSILRL